MKIVGLTGGIGSGKTLVATMFRGFGIPIYDSDLKAKYLMNTSKRLRKDIVALLGQEAYKNGELDRNYVAGRVFNNEESLKRLNALVHPTVQEDLKRWVKKQNSLYVIQETALIFENNLQDRYDYVILVTAPENLRIERVIKRDGQSEKMIKARISNQLDDRQKMPMADFVINNIVKEKTHESVFQIHKAITAEAG